MAKLDDLKVAWQSESGISPERFEQIGHDVSETTDRLQSVIIRRDMLETFASMIVIAGFGFWMWVAKSWLERLGCATIVLAGVSIPFVLWWARRRPTLEVSAGNFRDFVDVEVEYLRRQSLLLRQVGWWYLLPLYIGIVLIMVGVLGPTYRFGEIVGLVLGLGAGAVAYIYLWWINQTARKKNLDPMLRYYEELRDVLERGEGFDALVSGPPSEFLQPGHKAKITRRARWWGVVLTLICTLAVVIGGYLIVRMFDTRAGWFVVSTAPVVAALMGVCSGLLRPLKD